MNKKIWIFNHYAIEMYFNEGGRHYWFSKYLKKEGYEVTIFSSNIRHNSTDTIDINKGLSKSLSVNGIDFVFVKTFPYKGNGLKRIINMMSFYRNLIRLIKRNYKTSPPDIIIASSVHPLTLMAGIKIKKMMSIPLITEIRDLWPESLVAYGYLKRNSLLAKLLYNIEKKIYIASDKVIMTWEGGKDYIQNQGWSKQIPLEKIEFIPNGFDKEDFNRYLVEYPFVDKDLEDQNSFKVVYTGSVRKVNNLGFIIDSSKHLNKDVIIYIFGAGDQVDYLKERINKENVKNVKLKGVIPKKYIPSLLSKADLLLLHYKSTSLDQYGQSQNKLFEYIASNKPILQTYNPKYDIIKKHNFGISMETQNKYQLSKSINTISHDGILKTLHNDGAYIYDFKHLTKQLEQIIVNMIA